jgi:ABC-type multidrug transport system fused ATPase/permease subunit
MMGARRWWWALRRAVDGWSDEALGKPTESQSGRAAGKIRGSLQTGASSPILGTVIFSATSYTQPVLIGMATDYALAGNVHDLVMASLGLVALALLAWASYFGYMSTTAWMGHRVLLTLRREMFTHLQKLSLSFYDRNAVGRVMSRVQNDVPRCRNC